MESVTVDWNALGAISTALATMVALGILVRDIILRRRDARTEVEKAERSRHIDLLTQIHACIIGRERLTGPRINDVSADEASRQIRQEVQLPALVAQLPREYTILLRRSEAMNGVYWPTRREWEVGIDPWKAHPEWQAGTNIHPEIITADILASIHALATGKAKEYPTTSSYSRI